jgi:anti-sigma factor RsiW
VKNTMNCSEVQPLIDAYVDHELDLATSLRIERHLQACAACRWMCQNRLTLQTALKSDVLYFRPLPATQKRFWTPLNQAERKPLGFMIRFSNHWKWMGVAALALAVALVLGLFTGLNSVVMPEDRLVADVVSNHIRSLMVDHLTDVISSDQHTVKPWFDGKLTYAPPVIDLAPHGFPLVGGRLDYVKNVPVAALVYRSDKHYINLFIWPTGETSRPAQQQADQQGYHLVHWSEDNMVYWAVSDLEVAKLQAFGTLFRNADSATP